MPLDLDRIVEDARRLDEGSHGTYLVLLSRPTRLPLLIRCGPELRSELERALLSGSVWLGYLTFLYDREAGTLRAHRKPAPGVPGDAVLNLAFERICQEAFDQAVAELRSWSRIQ
ncbi:MAG: hypothetical protein Kow001_18800 [Acidobacteriota bacterium]